ncbi:septal ring lytic transglycosylase RlpA family protein [Moraxella nasicaprae]|uniref:Endolytic peptidoglycan transglycosylase RlpA n=1 Tax=Moraxella nasicaprae TaxID=2904122 RepID=A0ABY6F4T7_9GAMM|nr:septal ring lytic transglycosylase RlpA family protein [Moraxella nasicaprae]UXZ04910.1 septal ring lytic transglycosylase RlpA family protein [Moraxella nasicaprae]
MNTVSKSLMRLAGITLGVSLGLSAQANSTANTANIDRVLNQLTAQHNNTSSLVRNARQSASLSLSSPLVQQTARKEKATNDNSPVLEKLTAVASSTVNRFKQTGIASWYGRQFHGRKTANGETFDMNAMTAAHSTLPMNCYVRVTNHDNGKSVIVKINDRPKTDKVLDLSYGAARAIGISGNLGNVTIERVDGP